MLCALRSCTRFAGDVPRGEHRALAALHADDAPISGVSLCKRVAWSEQKSIVGKVPFLDLSHDLLVAPELRLLNHSRNMSRTAAQR